MCSFTRVDSSKKQQEGIMSDDFYLTLPSNNESKKYFPDITHDSWKTRLPTRNDLNGSWEVGLSCISLPQESLLANYLEGLTDDTLVLVSSRIKIRLSDDHVAAEQYTVTDGEIKDREIITVHDLLKALFDVEREKCIIDLGDAWATTLVNGDKAQFKVIADDEGEMFTVTAEDVSSSIFDSNFRNYVKFLLKNDFCQLMGWRRSESVSYHSGSVKRTVSVHAPGPNLIMKKKTRSYMDRFEAPH